MFRLIYFLLFLSLVASGSATRSSAQTAGEREIDEIKLDVSRLYTINSKKIVVHLKSGSSVKGYINEVDSESFTVFNAKTRTKVVIRYDAVSRIKRSGLTQAQKTALIAAGIGAIVTVGIILRPKAKGGLRCLLCN